MKDVASVYPKIYPHNSNFKVAPFQAWVRSGGGVVSPHYKLWPLHIFLDLLEGILPKSKTQARLIFAEPPSLSFDSFPSYGHYEIIPVLWDCWPYLYEKTMQWFLKHRVRSAIFTSSQTAKEFKKRFPDMNILAITEGIETDMYCGNKRLSDRSIDFLCFGRVCDGLDIDSFPREVSVLKSRNEQGVLSTRSELIRALSDSKITFCVPRCDNQPEIAGGVETLTQRYWECMLSGIVIVGRAPQELIDLIGYNPIVPANHANIACVVNDVLSHIDDYQFLVEKNREYATNYASWDIRIRKIREWLREVGYKIGN